MSPIPNDEPATWDPADHKTVDEIVDENRETFESIAENGGVIGNVVRKLLRDVDGEHRTWDDSDTPVDDQEQPPDEEPDADESVWGYCPHCGDELPIENDWTFCPHCGTELGT